RPTPLIYTPALHDALPILAAHPTLIHTSVTPFGDRPPGRALRADDLVLWAMGGPMYLCGDEDRPPTRVPLWQAFCHAGAEAAVRSEEHTSELQSHLNIVCR